MASCNDTVLTGQEGLIQFKPLGTTNCVDDYCPWGGVDSTGTATPERLYIGCGADYDIGDCIEIEAVKIPSTSSLSDGTSNVVTGSTYYVVFEGVGAAGDDDNCGNSMEGVPYIYLSATAGGTPIQWDVSNAGTEISTAGLTGDLTITNGGTDYTLPNGGGDTGVATDVDLINTSPTRIGSGARASVTIASGIVTKVTITSGGDGYNDGDVVYIAMDNGLSGLNAVLNVTAANVVSVRGNSSDGNYILRLCDFQTVCGVRSFSIDLSRDELDVTTLPCSVSEACGKELASFRKTQAGFATATGTLEVYFSCDQTSTANKILTGSLQKTQGGASVRLYVCTKTDAQGEIVEEDSLYIEADIQLLGMSFSVNPDDPTTATINFGVTSVTSAFGLS
jgi:hypothetical protein